MMKITYLNRLPPRSRPRRLWIIALALLIVVVAPILDWFRGGAVFLARPVWWVGERFQATAAILGALFQGQTSLLEENRTLKNQLAALEQRTIDYDLLVREKQYLESVLGRAPLTTAVVVARVLAGPHQTPEEILIVDRGLKNTISQFVVGDVVTVEGTIALGKVEEVGGRVSQVKLFSAPGTELPVRIGLTQLPAVAQGRGGGNFLITLPRGLDVPEGSLVTMLSGERQLVLGEVTAIDRDLEGTLQDLLIRFPVNLLQLSHVEINLTPR